MESPEIVVDFFVQISVQFNQSLFVSSYLSHQGGEIVKESKSELVSLILKGQDAYPWMNQQKKMAFEDAQKG